jgi:hypothetical protein
MPFIPPLKGVGFLAILISGITVLQYNGENLAEAQDHNPSGREAMEKLPLIHNQKTWNDKEN